MWKRWMEVNAPRLLRAEAEGWCLCCTGGSVGVWFTAGCVSIPVLAQAGKTQAGDNTMHYIRWCCTTHAGRHRDKRRRRTTDTLHVCVVGVPSCQWRICWGLHSSQNSRAAVTDASPLSADTQGQPKSCEFLHQQSTLDFITADGWEPKKSPPQPQQPQYRAFGGLLRREHPFNISFHRSFL
jgi:hypothetical protein